MIKAGSTAFNLIMRYARKRLAAPNAEGIMEVMSNKQAMDFVKDLVEEFNRFGVPESAITVVDDVGKFANQIVDIKQQRLMQEFKKQMTPKKSADIIELQTGKKIDQSKGIMGGRQVDQTDDEATKALQDKLAKDKGYQKYRGETEEQIRERFKKQNKEAIERFKKNMDDLEDKATGGRVGLKTGMSKRAFLKLMGGAAAGIGALKTGALKMFGKETVKKIPQVVKTPPAPGKPAWFDSVVNRVIAEGDDVTKQFAYKERMQVNTKQISPTEEVTVYRDLDDGSVRINYGAKMRIDETKPYERGNIGRASNDPDQVDLIVREGVDIEPSIVSGPMKGKAGRKTESSFEASEAEPRSVGGPEDADIEFDGIREVDNVDDLMQDVSTLEEFGTGKKLTGDKAAKAKKKREDYQRFTEDQVEQAEYLETKYGPAERYYGDPDDYASGGLAGMLGE